MKEYLKPEISIYSLPQDVLMESDPIGEENVGGYLDDWSDIHY